MKYERTGEATSYPITLDTAKAHLVVEHYDDDALIAMYLAQAVEYCEAKTGLHIGEQQWALYADGWCGTTVIPFKPVRSAVVSYLDTNGDKQPLDPAIYVVDTKAYPCTIAYTDAAALPELFDGPNNVIVDLETGGSTMPKTLEAAVLLTLGHLYEHREESTHVALTAIPLGVDAFLNTVSVPVL